MKKYEMRFAGTCRNLGVDVVGCVPTSGCVDDAGFVDGYVDAAAMFLCSD